MIIRGFMSAPYLNRGESIILTTHRVSAGSLLYDLLLTNERLILMDSRYTRFEPRMIHFAAISSVKGGKVPTGEPVIILILDESDSVSGTAQVDLIFTQQPGEQRKEERELWVRKIIELVISARERAMQKPVPKREKTGLHPTIRRFVAPEPARPHTSVQESAPRVRRIIATPDETDLPVFNRNDLPQFPEIPPSTDGPVEKPEDEPAFAALPTPAEAGPEDFVPAPREDARPGREDGAESVSVPDDRVLELLFEEVAERQSSKGEGESPADPFADTVQSALLSLQSGSRNKERPDVGIPVTEESGEPSVPEITLADIPPGENREEADTKNPQGDLRTPEHHDTGDKLLPDEPEPPREPGRGNGLAAPEPAVEMTVIPPSAPTSIKDEKPEIPAPDSPVLSSPKEPQKPEFPARQTATGNAGPSTPGTSVPTTILLILIAVLVLSGGILILSHYLPGEGGTPPEATVTPETTVPQTMTPVPPAAIPAGVRVDVIYPGIFSGTVGNPGYLHQVSGTGNRTFTILMTSGIVQATIRKQDNSGDSLLVAIYDNSTLLAQQTVTAPGGEVNLLIDTKTSSPPGMVPDTPPADNITLSGNATLVYY